MRFEMLDTHTTHTARHKVLFVCAGNICRSPVAQAILSKKLHAMGCAKNILVESAGTHAQVGAKADSRSQHAAAFRGYSLLSHSARQVEPIDFLNFDLILAMDWANLRQLQLMAPSHSRHKIELLMRYAQDHESAEVPDPNNGGQEAFNLVVDYIEDAINGLIETVSRRLLEPSAA